MQGPEITEITPKDLIKELGYKDIIEFTEKNNIRFDFKINHEEQVKDFINNLCSNDKNVFKNLVEFTRTKIFERKEKKSSYSFYIPLTGYVFSLNKKEHTSKELTKGRILSLKEYPPNIQKQESGFVFFNQKEPQEKEVKFIYQHITSKYIYDWEKLKKYLIPISKDITIKYTNPTLFIEETQTGTVKHIRKILQEKLETYFHPLGIYYSNNSTEIIKKFNTEVLENQSLMQNSKKYDLIIKRVRLKFREEKDQEISLDNIEATGNKTLEHKNVQDLIKKGGKLIKIICIAHYKDKKFIVNIASYADVSYISVVKENKSIPKEDTLELLELLKTKYFEMLPPESRNP